MAIIVPKHPRIARIQPAEIAFDSSGTPYSPLYGDVYHSADSGPGQAQHVFVEGSALPQAWAGARVYSVLETGFGLGLNFLATWRAWRADAARAQRLHFVSIEKHPLDRDALVEVHARYREFAPLAAQLHEAWPPLVPGLHRLHLEGAGVTLTLAFGDVAALLPRLRLRADAIYLDGYAPQRNAEMWSPRVMKGLARLSRPGTTLATWSTAAAVRGALEAAGYALEKRPGFGRKREMLCGRYAPRWRVQRPPPCAPAAASRHAIVVGAGLAGAGVCERLAARGWRIDLIERSAPSAPHAPARFAGIFHPHVSVDDCILSRVARSGFLYAVSRWRALERAGFALAWSRCGVLQLQDGERAAQASHLEHTAAFEDPAAYAQYVTRARAEALAGCRLPSGGWWFPGGGWLRAGSLIAAQLAAAGRGRARSANPPGMTPGCTESTLGTSPGAARPAADASLTSHYGTAVDAIARCGDAWHALAADGSVIAAAPVLILANANDAARLAGVGQGLARVRGQVTFVPAEKLAAPRTVVAGAGHVLPATDGIVVTGSTYDRGDDPTPQVSAHEANLMRLSHMLPGALQALDPATLEGAVGFRCVAPDRLPLVGALPDVGRARARKAELAGAHLIDLPRRAGLYCVTGFASRGLIWAALAGEMLASALEGEPLPLEGDLADALDPARFVLRQLRSGTL